MKAVDLSHAAIRQYADRIIDHHGFINGAEVIDLEAAVTQLGGTIEVALSPVAPLAMVVSQGWTIYLQPFNTPQRNRFHLAHELGRYFLQVVYEQNRQPRGFLRGDWADQQAAVQANVFASVLMMPTPLFQAAIDRGVTNPQALADHFGVSNAAAQLRCKCVSA